MNPQQDNRHVYLMETGKDRIYKIGYTRDIPQRIQGLNSQHKEFAPFEIRKSILTSNFVNVEAYLHARYEEHRLEGEFFHFSSDILSAVLIEFNMLNYAYQNSDVIYELFIIPYIMDEAKAQLEMIKPNNQFANMFNGRPVITVTEAHAYTGIKPHTIYRYLNQGHWESVSVGGIYLIYLDQQLRPPMNHLIRCQYCGEVIKGARRNQVYCDSKCKKSAQNRRYYNKRTRHNRSN